MSRTIRSPGLDALRAALVEARTDAGLTQRALATRLGCQPSLIAKIETGQRRIDLVELIVLARALRVPVAEFVKVAEAATPTEHRI